MRKYHKIFKQLGYQYVKCSNTFVKDEAWKRMENKNLADMMNEENFVVQFVHLLKRSLCNMWPSPGCNLTAITFTPFFTIPICFKWRTSSEWSRMKILATSI
ncbi:hypothetical protein KIN20_002331 [Parelaphostrongylus tenuis]|uniref:Uncharacterized protein n=1 Tax=Parelaphostrongylus tenuis TaxID=148309 RepID=A0AAD5LYB3_PARTN|nr:hypothetical protein KIN20_002331 [Parelaphostrongylus tenuis]